MPLPYLNGRLGIAELDSIEVEYGQGIGGDEGVQGQNLEHLKRRHQRATALLDHVADCNWGKSIIIERIL